VDSKKEVESPMMFGQTENNPDETAPLGLLDFYYRILAKISQAGTGKKEVDSVQTVAGVGCVEECPYFGTE